MSWTTGIGIKYVEVQPATDMQLIKHMYILLYTSSDSKSSSSLKTTYIWEKKKEKKNSHFC